jgi:hypothetical protein
VDTVREPFTPLYRIRWPYQTPWGTATFKLRNYADGTLSFDAIMPSLSLQQDEIVGVRRDLPALNTQVFTFGFHLWYMDSVDAKNLVSTIFSANPTRIWSKSLLEPNKFHIIEVNALEPKYAYFYSGNFGQGRSPGEIDLNSVLIDDTLSPHSIEVLPQLEGFEGEVLKVGIPVRDLLLPHYPLWGTLPAKCKVAGVFLDGMQMESEANYEILGKMRGDINNDNSVNILDLTILINYLFRGQAFVGQLGAADLDGSNSITVLDLTALIDKIFRGGF